MMERLDAGVFFGRPKVRLALDGLRVTESVYREGLDLPRHSHVAAHFCFVLEGAYVERLGAKAHERVPESLVWHPAGTSHSERHQTIGRHLIEIASERLETLDLPSSDIDAPRQVEGAEASWLIRRVERETRDPDSASALAVEGAVIGLIAETARRREPRGRQDEPRWMRRSRLIGTPRTLSTRSRTPRAFTPRISRGPGAAGEVGLLGKSIVDCAPNGRGSSSSRPIGRSRRSLTNAASSISRT